MAIRLNKTSKIVFAILIFVLSISLGFLVWRINQEDRLDPTDSDAYPLCPGNCSWNVGFEKCTGPGGCRLKGDGCTSGEEDWGSGYCCVPCTSKEPPAECLWYNENEIPNCIGTCAADYYSCTDKVCQKCKPENIGSGMSYDECAKERDRRNGGISCTGGATYYWNCADRDDGNGYDLVQDPCKEEEKPTVDCSYDLEPKTYAFNKANTDASKIGPFPEDGTLVLFFKSLLPDGDGAYRPKITFKLVSSDSSRNNKQYVYSTGSAEERKVTDFTVKKGEYLLLTDSDDNNNQGSPECAPTTNNPKYKSFGWIAPSGGLCGSGLDGPPTNGTRTPYEKVNISSFRNNAVSQGYKQLPKGEQCWADWREWAGDYDFNDYFLMASYLPEEAPVPTSTPDFRVEKSVVESCTDEGTDNPVANLSYSIKITNVGGAEGTLSKIVDTLDSKVTEVSSITDSGVFSVGKVTWEFTTPLSLGTDEEKILTYKVAVEKEDFGLYENTVVVSTSEGDVTANANITADCIITETPEEETPTGEVPQTGLFDSTASRIGGGLVLVIFGIFIYSMPNTVFALKKREETYKYREKFEKKVANR